MGCVEIDIHKLAEKFMPNGDDNIIVDGHLSHFLEVDAIIILRCEPAKLRKDSSLEVIRGQSKCECRVGIDRRNMVRNC